MEMREGCSSFQFPPGFRFHPSDQELIVHYLQNKVTSRPLPASLIAEIDLYKFNPWELPKKALFGEDEWYFFSPRDRKYPNGARPNRAAASGYWKATGTDKPILTSSGSRSIGVKKGLVFYTGRPPKGIKTDWIMNEYRVLDTTLTASRFKRSMRLDDWVLCRVRQKGNTLKNIGEVQENPSPEMVRYLTKIEEEPNTYTNNNTDLITDYLYKDCCLLASILAGQALPPIKSISNLSFQGSNNDNIFTSVSKDGCNKVNIYSNEGKLSEENKYENLLRPSKTLPNNRYDMNCYCQSQYQDEIFKHNPLEPNIDFQLPRAKQIGLHG